MRWGVVLAAMAGAIVAAPGFSYEAAGTIYDLNCNKDGYVLTSRYPVQRRVQPQAAMSQLIEGQESIYLGRHCDAYHEALGYGSWCWANGGFFATFPHHEFMFGGRQELICQSGPTPGAGCHC